jgi:hypothetical protein
MRLAQTTYHPQLGETVTPFTAPPWQRTAADYGGRVTVNANESRVEKDDAAKAHNRKIRDYDWMPEHLAVYSDGSLLENRETGGRSVGYATVGYHEGEERFKRGGPMGANSEVYDAEMAGLAWAACDAVEYATRHDEIRHLHFFADNTSALKNIFDPKTKAGQHHMLRFRRCVEEFLERHPGNKISTGHPATRILLATSERTDSRRKRRRSGARW